MIAQPCHGRTIGDFGNQCSAAVVAVDLPIRDVELLVGWPVNDAGFEDFALGIAAGIGECVVGNMGSTQRFDYTVLGDTVNLASRLEGQSGEYGFQIIAGADTVKSLSGYEVFELDLLAVKGKTEPVTIYTVFEGAESDIDDAEAFRVAHQEFLKAYRGQDWDAAMYKAKAYKSFLLLTCHEQSCFKCKEGHKHLCLLYVATSQHAHDAFQIHGIRKHTDT